MSDDLEVVNAVITETRLTSADHGVLSAWVILDYGGSGQGFGGYALYVPNSFHAKDGRTQPNYAGHFIWRVLQIAGVSEWKDLPGKTVRVRRTWSKVEAIGHIVKDDWFDPGADIARQEGR